MAEYGRQLSDDGDYITINPAVGHARFNVVIMRQGRGGEFIVARISNPLREEAAKALAQSWASATGLEVR